MAFPPASDENLTRLALLKHKQETSDEYAARIKARFPPEVYAKMLADLHETGSERTQTRVAEIIKSAVGLDKVQVTHELTPPSTAYEAIFLDAGQRHSTKSVLPAPSDDDAPEDTEPSSLGSEDDSND